MSPPGPCGETDSRGSCGPTGKNVLPAIASNDALNEEPALSSAGRRTGPIRCRSKNRQPSSPALSWRGGRKIVRSLRAMSNDEPFGEPVGDVLGPHFQVPRLT